MSLTRAQAFYVAGRRALDAWFVRFDNTGTSLAATNVQDAIAELDAGGGGSPELPTGGTADQVLAKVDGTDGNVYWKDDATGGGVDILQVQVFS